MYNNETSLTCSINASNVSNIILVPCQVSFSLHLQLILPTGAGQLTAEVDILWTGENSRGEVIYHSIDNFTAVSGKNCVIYATDDTVT